MSSKTFYIVMIVAVVGILGVAVTQKNSKKTNDSSAPIVTSTNYYGKLDSPVTLTEFVDFQCEACYGYYPHVKQVKEKYKDKIRFQVRNFPITSGHQFAFQAARTAEAAARQGKFWEMHDKIFEGQKQWERLQAPQTVFDGYASEIGLDMTKYREDFASSEVAAVINNDLADVQKLGGTGTPTFLLNGKKIESPKPSVEDFSRVIDEALREAGVQ